MQDKRLVRRQDDGMIAGVAAGVAETYGIDVTLVRLAFVGLAVITGGTAVILYLIAALIMPRADEGPGLDSIRHGVDDLMTRGKELYGETRRAMDRTPAQRESPIDATPGESPLGEPVPEPEPVTPATAGSERTP